MSKLAVTIIILILLLAYPAFGQTHTAGLSWTASSDAVANPTLTYNVYRLSGSCPASGTTGFVKVNSTAISVLTYSDGTVSLGTSCYYVTSVVNGAESLPSNLVSTVILPQAPSSLKVTSSN